MRQNHPLTRGGEAVSDLDWLLGMLVANIIGFVCGFAAGRMTSRGEVKP